VGRRPRVGPRASIGGIEHRHPCLVNGPGCVVQRVGRVILRLLGVVLGCLHITLFAFAVDASLEFGHLGRSVGLERLPLGMRMVSRLAGLAVNGFLRGLGLGPGAGHPRFDLLVRFMPRGIQRTLQVSHQPPPVRTRGGMGPVNDLTVLAAGAGASRRRPGLDSPFLELVCGLPQADCAA
jgi:hypothetical protein